MGIASALLLIDDSHANPRGWVGRWGGLWGGKKSHDHNIVWKKLKMKYTIINMVSRLTLLN